MARLFNPVVAVKDVIAHEEKKAYRQVHVLFQSTSSCNISTVNALPGCKVDVAKRERGVRENKRVWGIEMNAGRALYLGTYSRIDSIDHLIKNCRLKYRSWKYWHSPMLHGMGLAIVIAYDMYLELSEGKLASKWKTLPCDFWTFRNKLSKQMLQYDPLTHEYWGDAGMRVWTAQRVRDQVTPDGQQDEEDTSPERTRKRGRTTRKSVKART